jgi:ribonuclease HI
MKGTWRVKSDNLIPYWQQAKKLEKKFSKIEYNHVYRKNNKRADQLANMALDSEDLKDENEA